MPSKKMSLKRNSPKSGMSESPSSNNSQVNTSKIGVKNAGNAERKYGTISNMSKAFKRGTFTDYRLKQLEKSPLFKQIYTADGDKSFTEQDEELSSILVSGFGMRNIQSLEDALRMRQKERQRLLELYKEVETEEEKEETKCPSEISMKLSKSSTNELENVTFKSVSSETDTEKNTRDAQQQNLCIEYLLGLEKSLGEGESPVPTQYTIHQPSKQFDEFKLSKSRAKRGAQLYLLQHRILDFFQFVVAYLLGASPDDPIIFIIELLNKCLLYRSRLGKPPVLYEKKHLEQLFNLMDRMKCGGIEMSQYVNGITSLGICDFNENPETDDEGLITKKVFVDEAYKAQVIYLSDLIKIGQLKKILDSSKTPDTESVTLDSSGSYFIPSDLFRPLKKITTKFYTRTENMGG